MRRLVKLNVDIRDGLLGLYYESMTQEHILGAEGLLQLGILVDSR